MLPGEMVTVKLTVLETPPLLLGVKKTVIIPEESTGIMLIGACGTDVTTKAGEGSDGSLENRPTATTKKVYDTEEFSEPTNTGLVKPDPVAPPGAAVTKYDIA